MIPLLSKLILLAALVNPAAPKPVSPKLTNFTVPIMVYHHVSTTHGRWDVSPIRFEQELAYLLANEYHTVSMAAYADYLEKGTPLPDKPIILTFDDGDEDAYTTAYPLLKARHLTGTFYIITGKVGQPGFLTWDQIKEMSDNGMEIGAHTITHPFLTHLHPMAAYAEILGSRLDLQQHLGIVVTTFAYPDNDHNRITNLLVRLAGFRTACIVDFHSGDSVNDYFTIPRYTVAAAESLDVFSLVVNRRAFPGIPVRR